MFGRKIRRKYTEVINGDTITLYERDFLNIKNGKGHSEPHDEVSSHEFLLKEALENSSQVNLDRIKPDTDCYYGAFKGDKTYPPGFMKVVVKRTLTGKIILNAYYVSVIPSGETKVWPIRSSK